MTQPIEFVLNGEPISVDAPPHVFLLELLRDYLRLQGTKQGCDGGECGACTVLVDGVPTYSCLALARRIDGRKVTTVESLGSPTDLHPLQEAFAKTGAIQCGYCTPGVLMSTEALLARNPQPTLDDVKEALTGNICRCTGWQQIFEAILEYAKSPQTD